MRSRDVLALTSMRGFLLLFCMGFSAHWCSGFTRLPWLRGLLLCQTPVQTLAQAPTQQQKHAVHCISLQAVKSIVQIAHRNLYTSIAGCRTRCPPSLRRNVLHLDQVSHPNDSCVNARTPFNAAPNRFCGCVAAQRALRLAGKCLGHDERLCRPSTRRLPIRTAQVRSNAPTFNL